MRPLLRAQWVFCARNVTGQLFWASDSPPAAFKPAAAANNVTTLGAMDAATRAAIAALSPEMAARPCAGAGSGTLKCEACLGGCQPYSKLSTKLGLSNERTTYIQPGTGAEVLLYRSHAHALYATVLGPFSTRFRPLSA
jgi:hypothetical protein